MGGRRRGGRGGAQVVTVDVQSLNLMLVFLEFLIGWFMLFFFWFFEYNDIWLHLISANIFLAY